MKANKQQQQALLAFIGRIYDEIRALEEEFGIQAGSTDFRPRIEYFHDAIREFTSGRSTGHETKGRLTVESLAYDMEQLRQISGNPVSRLLLPQRQSPGTAIVPQGAKPARGGKPDSDVRYKLMDLYKNYTLLFVTILVEAADRNYYSRVGEHDNEVEELAVLESMMNQALPNIDLKALVSQQVADPDLKRKLLAEFQGKRSTAETKTLVKAQMKASDQSIAKIEKSHMSYLSAQLTIYQESRDMVKKMAKSGLNIVGDFLGAAMAEATRTDRGR